MKPQHPKPGGGRDARVTPGKPPAEAGEAQSPRTEDESEGKHAGGAGGSDGNRGNEAGGGERRTIGLSDEQALGGGSAPTHGFVESGGGSSPVVPILVAVAVLAALSIGSVVYRQRRQIPGR